MREWVKDQSGDRNPILNLQRVKSLKQVSYLLVGLVIITVGLTIAFVNGYILWPFGQTGTDRPLELAIMEFQRAIELEPDNEAGYRHLSRAYELAGRPEEAITVYRQAIEINPEAAWPRVGLGQLYLDKDQPEAAINELKQAIALEPDRDNAYAFLGRAYLSLEKPEAAIAAYEQAIALNPGKAWPYMNLGDAYLAVARPDEALAAYQQAITIEFDNANAYVKLGDFYQWQQQQLDRALVYYRRAAALEPERGWYRVLLGRALFAADRPEEGIEKLTEALRLEPESGLLQRIVGDALLQYRSPEEALPYFERAAQIDPQDAAAYAGLARIHREQGDYDQALVYAQQAEAVAQNEQDLGAIYYEQGYIYLAQQKSEQAMQKFLLAADLQVDAPWVQATVADFYLRRLNQPQLAIDYYRRALELAPDKAEYHLSLGKALLAAGQRTESVQSLEEALALAGDNVEIYLNLGYFASSIEDWDRTIQVYEQALAQGVSNADIYIRLGDAYQMINRPQKAMENYRRAAQLDPDHPELQQKLQGSS